MEYFQTRRHVGELLADLGHTSNEVARTLEDGGVRGTPGDVRGCAVALYLNAVLGAEANVRSVRVDRTSVRVLRGRPRISLSITMPEAVRTFVHAFDRRLYPELIRGDEEKARPASLQPKRHPNS